MGATDSIHRIPAAFTEAVEALQAAQLRPEIHVEPMPAPRRIAPHAFAFSGDAEDGDDEIATGRFILLHDPDGSDTWNGSFRCVTYMRSEVEGELATDPALPEVAWSWLTDALEAHGARHEELGGSVTVVRSEAFGTMGDDGASAQVEIRASWTPLSADATHLHAWGDALCHIGGAPPVEPGVVSLHNRRPRR